jgi:hypothetical protein
MDEAHGAAADRIERLARESLIFGLLRALTGGEDGSIFAGRTR